MKRGGFLACLLAACQPAWIRTLDGLADQGDYVAATDAALKAHASGEKRALELLIAVGAEATGDLLDRARQEEADGNYEASLQFFDAYIDLSERLRAVGAAGHELDVGAERAAVSKKFAYELFGAAAVALEGGRPEEALAGWERAEVVNAAATDADRQIPIALTQIGHARRLDGRYREAIAAWERAVSAGGGEEPKMWAAAVRAALGRHALRQGACRAAASELVAASILPFDLQLGADLAQAQACAQREAVVRPFDDLVPGGIQGSNVRVLLADQLTHLLRARGSRHLTLLEPQSPQLKTPYAGPGRRVEISGHLTRATVAGPTPSSREVQTTGVLKVPCQPGGDPTCDEEVRVTYTLNETTVRVELAGTVKVIEPSTGEQLALRPVELQVAHVRRVGESPKITDVRGFVVQATVGSKASDRVVGLRSEARPHFEPQPALPDVARVVDEAVVRLASVAADVALAAVDTEPMVPDPPSLVVVPPITRAEDVRFGEGTIYEDRAEDLDLGPGLSDSPR